MIPTSRWRGGTKEEYETQHFGFGAQQLQLAVRQMVEQKITSCIHEMRTSLEGRISMDSEGQAALGNGCSALERLYCERAQKPLAAIDREFERILAIPSHVVLPGDEPQAVQLSDNEYIDLQNEVIALRRRIERAAIMEALLTAEEEELAASEKICEIAKKDMQVLDLLHKNLECSDSVISVQKNAESLAEKVPHLTDKKDFFWK